MYDLGDVVPLRFTVRDAGGNLANAGSAVLTITLPDDSTTTPTLDNTSTGLYDVDYLTTAVGRHLVRFVTAGSNAGAYSDVFDVRAAAAVPIVSLADVKRALDITSNTNDEELRDCLDRASSILEREYGRPLRKQTIVETHSPGPGRSSILLRPPVVSVTSLVVDGTALPASDYDVDGDTGVLTIAGRFDGSRGAVVVTYVAGYADPPGALKEGVIEQVRHMWDTQRTTPGAREESWNPGMAFEIPNRVREAMRDFRVAGIA